MGNLRSIDIETRHYKEPVISRKQTVVMRLERCPRAGHCCPAVAHQVFVLEKEQHAEGLQPTARSNQT